MREVPLYGYLAHAKPRPPDPYSRTIYRVISLKRKRNPLGPYRRPMSRVLGGS
jgi:hypothetical protein